MDDDDGVSIGDITLAAHKPRRKSTRRSMVIFPSTRDSPIGYSSPKVLVHRHSLGRGLSSAERPRTFPSISAPTPSHSIAVGSTSAFQIRASFGSQRQLPLYSPSAKSPSVDDENPSFPTALQNAQPQTIKSPPLKTEQKPLNEEAVVSVGTLVENYERELTAWPNFIQHLEARASLPLEVPQMTREELQDNPMLGAFANFICHTNEDVTSIGELQGRVKSAYTSAVANLVKLAQGSWRTRQAMFILQRQLKAERNAKLKQHLPHLASNAQPVGIQDLTVFLR